jgi:excisionase family DNA binding protein
VTGTDEIGSREFAERVGWSYRTTMRKLAAGEVPGARRGGRTGREWRIPRASVEAVLRQQAGRAQGDREDPER